MKLRLLLLILMFILTGNLNRFKTLAVLLAGVEDEAARQGTLASRGLSRMDGCRDLEERILAATVRIELLGWRGSGDERTPMVVANRAHATIKDGRYLVTHNHFEPSLAWPNGRYSAISLYRANGEILLSQAPITAFTVVTGDAETLVLEFADEAENGLFASLGLPSAEFAAWEALELRPGVEVAQINWNGGATEVQWVGVDHIITDGETPRIEMHSLIEPGASGGGVFWQGTHVANNWFRVVTRDADRRQILDSYSTAALNTPGISEFDGRIEMFTWSASSLVQLP
ncbi:MAG TPA: hypothetical protein VF177_14995 [Anaerolineae bacterium]